tara:strand:- start:791 stop:1192 length:402 start_codon:yes stop_codon:yes gene_type:complete
MKRGHYLNQARKAFAILDKFHTKMFDLGGEESEHWSDDFNCDESYLRRILDGPMGADDEHFVKLEKYDKMAHTCDCHIKDYKEQIKYLRKQIAREQASKDYIQKRKTECLVEWNMDYKTIEKRLTKQYPEFAP